MGKGVGQGLKVGELSGLNVGGGGGGGSLGDQGWRWGQECRWGSALESWG